MFFFVFKHKTAYEMRISDWSSDVCSSDLFDLTPELRLSTNFNRLDFVDTSSLEFLRNQGDIDTGIGWDLSAAVIWRPHFTQNVVFRLSGAVIGRASCREGVCQYV